MRKQLNAAEKVLKCHQALFAIVKLESDTVATALTNSGSTPLLLRRMVSPERVKPIGPAEMVTHAKRQLALHVLAELAPRLPGVYRHWGPSGHNPFHAILYRHECNFVFLAHAALRSAVDGQK
jgi:hypothetical protein